MMKRQPWYLEWLAGFQLLMLVGGPLLVLISFLIWGLVITGLAVYGLIWLFV